MTEDSRCNRCSFRKANCLCRVEPKIESKARFVILKHTKELKKETNTAILMERALSDCHMFIWNRIQPPAEVLTMLKDAAFRPWLIFPPTQDADIEKVIEYQHDSLHRDLFIIIDGTWQQAAKIVRKSPWLTDLPRLALGEDYVSEYSMRRNQKPGRVCTVEAAILLLQQIGELQQSKALGGFFHNFMKHFAAEKQKRAVVRDD